MAESWRHRLQAGAAKTAWALFRLLPVDVASAAGAALLSLIGPWLRAHKVADRNLRRAFPEKSDAEIRAILRGMWRNLGRTLGELPHIDRIVADPRRVTLDGQPHIDALRDDGRAGFMFAGHLANWEMAALSVAQRGGLPLHLFYRAPNNPLVEDFFRRIRRGAAGELLPKGRTGARRSVELLKSGEHIGMLVDQKMNDGIPVPFFGRDAMTAPALAQLALRFGLPIVPVQVVRTGGCRFHVTVNPPLDVPATGDRHADIEETMRRVNAMLEGWVRAHPEQWLWVHRRWPD